MPKIQVKGQMVQTVECPKTNGRYQTYYRPCYAVDKYVYNAGKAGTYKCSFLCLIRVWGIADIFVRDSVVVSGRCLELSEIRRVDHHHNGHAEVDTKRVAVDHAEERHQCQHQTSRRKPCNSNHHFSPQQRSTHRLRVLHPARHKICHFGDRPISWMVHADGNL